MSGAAPTDAAPRTSPRRKVPASPPQPKVAEKDAGSSGSPALHRPQAAAPAAFRVTGTACQLIVLPSALSVGATDPRPSVAKRTAGVSI